MIKEYLRRKGQEFDSRGFVKCMFHEDKTASAKLTKDGKRLHCFSCNRHMDLYDLVAEFENLDYRSEKQKFFLAKKWISENLYYMPIENKKERQQQSKYNEEITRYMKEYVLNIAKKLEILWDSYTFIGKENCKYGKALLALESKPGLTSKYHFAELVEITLLN